MKAKIILSSLLVLTLTSLSLPAYAYLDSGTGSMIIQMLFAGVAGLLAIIKLYWQKCKDLTKAFFALFKSKKAASSKDEKNDHDKAR